MTNKADGDLIIKSIQINGEAPCIPAFSVDGKEAAVAEGESMPQTVKIGEAGYYAFHEIRNGAGVFDGPAPGRVTYPRKVVYADFVTNRGNFRWKPSSGFE